TINWSLGIMDLRWANIAWLSFPPEWLEKNKAPREINSFIFSIPLEFILPSFPKLLIQHLLGGRLPALLVEAVEVVALPFEHAIFEGIGRTAKGLIADLKPRIAHHPNKSG